MIETIEIPWATWPSSSGVGLSRVLPPALVTLDAVAQSGSNSNRNPLLDSSESKRSYSSFMGRTRIIGRCTLSKNRDRLLRGVIGTFARTDICQITPVPMELSSVRSKGCGNTSANLGNRSGHGLDVRSRPAWLWGHSAGLDSGKMPASQSEVCGWTSVLFSLPAG